MKNDMKKLIKYGLLAIAAVCAFWVCVFFLLGVDIRAIEFMLICSVISAVGTGIVFYLDAIYEKLNPNQS